MLIWAAISLCLAVASSLLGFGGSEGAAAQIARVLAVVFLVLFLAALLAENLLPPRSRPRPRR